MTQPNVGVGGRGRCMMRGVLAAPPCRDMAPELAERHIGIAAERCLPAACSAVVGISTSKLREQAGQ